MELSLRDWFVTRWRKYFDGTELPITFYYTDREEAAQPAKPPVGHRCIIAALSQVRKGKALRFDAGSVGCGGAKRYLGFSEDIMPDFEYFLSTGIPRKALRRALQEVACTGEGDDGQGAGIQCAGQIHRVQALGCS